MAIRWVICPVDTIVTNPGDPLFDPETGLQDGVAKEVHRVRRPRVSTIKRTAPGQPDLNLGFAAWISSGLPGELNDWCVCFVRVRDAAAQEALDNEPDIVNILGLDFEDEDKVLASPLNSVPGWNQRSMDKLKNLLSGRGADVTGLTDSDPLWAWMERLADKFDPLYMQEGVAVRQVDPVDGGIKLRSWKPSDQRRDFGEKRLGFKPRGTWVRP